MGVATKVLQLAEATLPTYYDPDSGQEWTRARERYIRHDLVARLSTT